MISWIDIAVIVLYLAVLVVIGVVTARRIKSTEDYGVAGRKLGFPIVLGTVAATLIGAGATLGRAGEAYQSGISIYWAVLGVFIGSLLFAFFMAKKIRKIGVWTLPELLYQRYGLAPRIIGAVLLLVGGVVIFAAQLAGLGICVSSLLKAIGLDFTTAVLICGAIVVLYTLLGGLLAVAYTDFFQFLIFLPILGIVLPIYVFTSVGSPFEIYSRLPADYMSILGQQPITVLSWFFLFILAQLIDMTMWQRAAAARTGNIIKNAAIANAFLFVFWSFITITIGLAAVIVLHNLLSTYGKIDYVLPAMAIKYLPPGLIGLCFVALAAVLMSTASSILLLAGILIGRDIIQPLSKKGISDKKLLWISRVIVLVVGVIGIVIALYMTGIFRAMYLGYALFVGGAFIPVMAALFWKKGTRQGALWSMIVSMIVIVALYALGSPFGIEPILPGLIISAVLMYVISRATYKEQPAQPTGQ